jgi:UDP-3-O-[3-hydroxymyristoyl] glucosamine N-acyltransferase
MEFKATDIAAFLNGEVIGDSNVKVSGISKIEEGQPGTLSFLANPKYESYIYSTLASIVLVNNSFQPRSEIKTTLIKVKDAYQAFASLLDLYVQAKKEIRTGIENPTQIHETAKIGEDVYVGAFTCIGNKSEIGNESKIFPQVFIGDNVTVGEKCIIYAGVRIYDDSVIGNNCILHSGVVIGSDGFGFAPQEDGTYKKIPQLGNVVLEDNVEIGSNSAIDCGTFGSTIIRKGAKIDNLVQIAHNCEIGENTVIAGQTGLAGSCKVGKNCKFAGQVGLAGHLTIGDNVQIGAQSGVSKSIKDNEIVLSSPAFNYKDAIKTYTIIRNLPKLRQEVIQLQKDVKSMKKASSDGSE